MFVWPLRVYYEDTDSSGVVYYANYLKFMERARTEWLRALGFEQDRLARDLGILFVVRSVALDYHYPARFNDALAVHSRICEARRASLTFGQDVVEVEKGAVLCRGWIKIACVSADAFKARPIPTMIVEAMGDAS